jgi:hypothetical protein
MMTQTNIDYLFQVTAALADRARTGAETGDLGRPEFGAHLTQASETARSEPANRPPLSANSGGDPRPDSYRPPTRPPADNAPATETDSTSAEHDDSTQDAPPSGTEPDASDDQARSVSRWRANRTP